MLYFKNFQQLQKYINQKKTTPEKVCVNGKKLFLTETSYWGKTPVDKNIYLTDEGFHGFWCATSIEGYIIIASPLYVEEAYLVYAPLGRYISNFVGEDTTKQKKHSRQLNVVVKGYPQSLKPSLIVCAGFSSYQRAKDFADNYYES